MSNEVAKVIFPNGSTLFGIYAGSSSCVCDKLYQTFELAMTNLRVHETIDCDCGNDAEIVNVTTSYGGGMEFELLACMSCKALVKYHDPYDYRESLSEPAYIGS